MPAAFFLSFFVGLLTHLSSASFLTISLFPKALCSYAASFCGVSLRGFHWRLKLSLHTLVNDFFQTCPCQCHFLNFPFYPPTGGVLSYIARCHSSVCFWPHPLFGGFTRTPLLATLHYRSHSGGNLQNEGFDEQLGPELIWCNFQASERTHIINSAPFSETSSFRLRWGVYISWSICS